MEGTIDDLQHEMAQKLPLEKNTLKVVEECMELCEVLVKGVTKADGYKPPKSKVIEEMGDLLFRLGVLAKALDIEDKVQERFQEKAEQLDTWMQEKYN